MTHHAQLELKHISYAPISLISESGGDILTDIQMTVRHGEWISILGMNGSGKSTLLKVAAGLIRQGVRGSLHRAGIGRDKPIPIVMQHPDAGLIGSTPWEDVVTLLERQGVPAEGIVPLAEQSLKNVGLINRMHQPLETLSGGQKQLVAIAGCLAAEAPILLLDEVTAMLDPGMTSIVCSHVRRLNQQGTTVLWITQRLEELMPSDRTLVMSEGRIVFDDSAGELFRRASSGEALGSPGELLGFEAPYAVKVAWELGAQGIELPYIPLTVNQLAEAVSWYER
ncbi:ATP-binding cassette domain-containing protein [Paenibacillus paeoniae]|uniref:ATP-binding cassette domain-containing protein n=1 Tax=Paenibacillus paeoniae TaxID=2292705 RepID=A0A371PKC2_9BACL|nr:ATP-binding cassette domain-containing protein [Paenibacillus paeoniae]REK76593.1 ATP-binding cassette domain-containing protein [Paenibacillus paeoniae]